MDDYQNEIVRLADPYFESVLNQYNELMIDDTLYTFDFSNKELLITYPDNSDITINLGSIGSFFISQMYEECGTCKTWAVPKYYPNNEKLMAYKWITNAVIYNSIGAGLKYYRKNGRNKWKGYAPGQLTLHIDVWHEVEWYFSAFPLVYYDLTYKKRLTYNKDHNQWVFPQGVFIFYETHLCSTKFERIHCYTTDFWNDLHHDDECH